MNYRLDKSGDFIIEDYNRLKAFSSFFPGIAGLYGIPLWAFYVNRGQCVSSFGTKDKDGAILEFFPANQAYNLTPIKGFRTFLRLMKNGKARFYEPFRLEGKNISTKMIINPSKLEIEETNHSLGIRINISYITIPNESFAGLARRIIIENTSGGNLKAELIDGLPQIIPFGMTEWHQKHMSRTIEAWVRVLNGENNAPFYNLKINPQDSPELEYIERGNFFAASRISGNKTKMLDTVVDPDIVFGKNGDISYPRLFASDEFSIGSAKENMEGRSVCAFAYSRLNIGAGGREKIVALFGNVKDSKSVNGIVKTLKNDARYFENKLSQNEEIIRRLENAVFTKSSSDEFDFYTRQTYLDNLLRGGVPITLNTAKAPFVYYAYARKHGDPERDYNAFLLEPAHYSQGNGAYRDMNQNRRNDNLFNPDVKDSNILTFMNAIQLDGFNPHRIEGIGLYAAGDNELGRLLKKYIKSAPKREKVKKYFALSAKSHAGFTPGSLLYFLETENAVDKKHRDEFLKEILAVSVKEDIITPGEGYWVDHWTYNIDLIESYLACYPDRLKELLLGERKFFFYDTYLKVLPRDRKYARINGRIRQFGSVVEDEDKRRIIEGRKAEPRKVRTNYGRGKVYKTSLLAKLICVVANKTASLDPFGVGIELEAGKPGWCDGLNGLPGIFGSSLCEVFELKRLTLFIKSSVAQAELSEDYGIILPLELAEFLLDLEGLAVKNILSKSKKSNFLYWDSSQKRKEQYREKVWYGLSGREKTISCGEILRVLDRFLVKIENGLEEGFNRSKGLPNSYYINDVKKFSFITENRKIKLDKNNHPRVKALSFGHKALPLFLEGPVHAMRVATQDEAKSLYKAVRKSEIFDAKLKMYKISEPLENVPLEIGRSAIFTPGWLENESVWLHMEYKYLLEVLKSGLHEEFFEDFKNCLVAFQDPKRYGRSILENSSFIASSAYPDKGIHGSGFVARLTGTTTEFLNIWLLMTLGKNPFKIDGDERLYFEPCPAIPSWLFTEKDEKLTFCYRNGKKEDIILPRNTFSFCLLGRTLLVYHNPKRRNTFGKNPVYPERIILKKKREPDIKIAGSKVPLPYSVRIRDGFYERIDIELS